MARSLLLTLIALLLAPAALAQTDDLRRVVLLNGDVYVGTVEDESADPLVVRTTDGITRSFPRDQVELVAPLIRGRFFRTDPVKTRLVFAPTARTLGASTFRGDLAGFYPSVTAGVSDRVDLLATGFFTFGTDGNDGAAVTPLLGIKAQVYSSETVQVALGLSGTLVLGSGDNAYGAVPYGVATFGDETRAVSVGAGALVGGVGSDFDVANSVIVGLGAETQINNGVKFFVETLALVGGNGTETCVTDPAAPGGQYCYTDDDIGSGAVIMPGVRFFGDKFAFDVIGFIATDFEAVYGFAPIPARLSYTF